MIGKRPVLLEWRYFENAQADEQHWATALSPAMDATFKTDRIGYWRLTRWYDLFLLISLVAVLLWIYHPQRTVTPSPARAPAGATISTQAIPTVGQSPQKPQTIILPDWQPMEQALQRYFGLCQQHASIWRYIAQRPSLWQQASTLPLYALFPDDRRYRAQIYHWSPAVQEDITLMMAGTFAEYIIAGYGQERLTALLNGFSLYTTWTELSSTVFGVPASQLEADWHTYIEQHTGDARSACSSSL